MYMEQLTLNFQDSPSTKEAASPYIGTKSRTEVGTSDLIAGILGTAMNERTAAHLDSLSLATLPDLSRHDFLAACPAFSIAEFERIMDAVELGRRVADRKSVARLPRLAISSTTIAISYCREHFARLISDAKQEELHVLTLDTKNHVIDSHRITVGTLDASLVHPREVWFIRLKRTSVGVSLILIV